MPPDPTRRERPAAQGFDITVSTGRDSGYGDFHVLPIYRAYVRDAHVPPGLAAPQPLTLALEPDNRDDRRAVAVYFGERRLGYLPREDRTVVLKLQRRGAPVTCRLIGVQADAEPSRRLSVEVALVYPPHDVSDGAIARAEADRRAGLARVGAKPAASRRVSGDPLSAGDVWEGYYAASALAIACVALLLAAVTPGSVRAQAAAPPNVLFVLADDLGYGEVGFNGQERIRTPRLDRLAREGMVLTAHYAGSTVCAPSRASLMSGLHQGRAPIRGNRANVLPDSIVTPAEVLRAAGYRTGLFGKWGLGDVGSAGEPSRQGFDTYFGYLDQVHAHNHYPSYLVRDGQRVALDNEVVEEQVSYGPFVGSAATAKRTYSQDLFTAAAADFIRDAAAAGEPFFAFVPVVIPHVNNESALVGAHGMEVPSLGAYADEDWPAVERAKAAMISYLDADVGRLVDLVDSLGLRQNTLVVFTSDNGPTAEQVDPAFFDAAGPYRGHKRDLYEGGIRVPTVVRWPGVVPPGTASDAATAFWDWTATLADLAGEAASPLLDSARGDGLTFAAELRGEPAAAVRERPYLYWEFAYGQGSAQAIRAGRWKWIRHLDTGAEALYDLEADPGETTDVSAREPAELTRLRGYAEAAHVPHPTYPLPGEG